MSSTAVFHGLSEAALEEAVGAVDWLLLPGGEALFQRGDAGDSLYIVVSGRLKIVREGPDGVERLVREVGKGDNVGELGILTGEPRVATVRAIRDTELARLSRERFDGLIEKYPRPMIHLTRMLARWLGQTQRSTAQSINLITLAVIPLHQHEAVSATVGHLTKALSAVGPTLHLNAESLDAQFGPGAQRTEESDVVYGAITHWLNEQENSYHFIVYESTIDSSSWMRRCIRQADRILAVALGNTAPAPGLLPSELAVSAHERDIAAVELVLLHPEGTVRPVGTAAWLSLRPFAAHHHVLTSRPADLDRVVRHLTGRAVGLVLSGGGARAYAHIGVIRALQEAGVSIDRVGGASVGSLIGAQYAYGYDPDGMLKLNQTEWVNRRPLKDYTLPLVAMTSGRGPARALLAGFGQGQLEDLWLPYFCVTTNLTRAELAVHRTGPVVKWVQASMSIPGILPPVATETGDLLVDGSVLNNVPVDVMRRLGVGPVIAVDVSPRVELALAGEDHRAFTPWQLLRGRKSRTDRDKPFPTMFRILTRTALVSGAQLARRARSEADLYLTPPVGGFDMFDWRSIDRIAEAGYSHAREKASEWLRHRAGS